MKKTALLLITIFFLSISSCSNEDDGNATGAVDNSLSIENLSSRSPFNYKSYVLETVVDGGGCTSSITEYQNTEILNSQNLELTFSSSNRSLDINIYGTPITADYNIVNNNIVFIDTNFNEIVTLENVVLNENELSFSYATFIGCPSGAQIDVEIKGRYTVD